MQGKFICKYCLNSFESLTKEVNSNPDSFCHPLGSSLAFGSCLAPQTSPQLAGGLWFKLFLQQQLFLPLQDLPGQNPFPLLVWSQAGGAERNLPLGRQGHSPGQEKKLNLSISLLHIHCRRVCAIKPLASLTKRAE